MPDSNENNVASRGPLGIMHVHSTYSDGEFSLKELRETFLDEDCAFICMTDHAEYFDEDKFRAYSEECERLSCDRLRFVPGLEYSCERKMHILGYGARLLATSQEPQEVIRFIEDQGAVSVIAHPRDDSFEWIESFESLPMGIEAWNTKYDGQYAPRAHTFALIQRAQQRRPELKAFYGLDLHWRKQNRLMRVELESREVTRDSVIRALSEGKFQAHKGGFALPSNGTVPQAQLAEFAAVNVRSRRLTQILKNGKKVLDRVGIRVPSSIKAQLRRIF